MKLFHQLDEQDQQNCVHYCIHTVVEDLIDGDLKLNASSDLSNEIIASINKVIDEARKLPEEDQFGFMADSEASDVIFDIALDLAKKAYYHDDEDFVIHYEELRIEDEANEDDESNDTLAELLEDGEINTLPKKGKFGLN